MAITQQQIAERLYKKLIGVADTAYPLTTRNFNEEPYASFYKVLPDQIWAQADSIPSTAPVLADQATLGVVKYWEKLQLSGIAGTDDAFYSANLKNAIPFNYGDGSSYFYSLYASDSTTPIYFGDGDWIVDVESGVLTFYSTPSVTVDYSNPPYITFYQYVGTTGLLSGGTSSSGANLTVKDPVNVASTTSDGNISGYQVSYSGFSYVPDLDGITGSTWTNGDRILIKNQTNEIQNGIFEVSSGTLIRPSDADSSSGGTVSINDYVFVLSGDTQTASSWILSDTTAISDTNIDISFETQVWKLFSQGVQYTADGDGLKLLGNQFYIDLDEVSNPSLGSGLVQGVNGLKLTNSILNDVDSISGLTSDLTLVSGYTQTNLAAIVSNDADIAALSGWTGTLASEISSNTTNITSLSGWTTSIELRVVDTESDILVNSGNITSLSGWTTTLSSSILNNASDILVLSGWTGNIGSAVVSNDSDIAALSGWTGNIYTDLVSLSGWTTTLYNTITSVEGDVTTLQSDVVALSGWTGTIESRVAVNESDIAALSGATVDLSGAAGSGLTFVSADNSLNVNADDLTVKLSGDTILTSPIVWMQQASENVSVDGYMTLALSYTPIGQVTVYVNGIKYLANPNATSSTTNMPFYFSATPPVQGSNVGFDPTEAGFTLVNGTDYVYLQYDCYIPNVNA